MVHLQLSTSVSAFERKSVAERDVIFAIGETSGAGSAGKRRGRVRLPLHNLEKIFSGSETSRHFSALTMFKTCIS